MNPKWILIGAIPAIILLQVFIPMILDIFSALLLAGCAGYAGWLIARDKN